MFILTHPQGVAFSPLYFVDKYSNWQAEVEQELLYNHRWALSFLSKCTSFFDWCSYVMMNDFSIKAIFFVFCVCFESSKAEFMLVVLHLCRSRCIPTYLLCERRLMKLVHVLERLPTKEWNVAGATLKNQPWPSSLGVFSLAPALHCPCCTSPRWAMCPI